MYIFILFQLAKKYKNGQLPKVDWSDRLAFREIEVINETEKRSSNFFHLMIEFPSIEFNSVPVSHHNCCNQKNLVCPAAELQTI